jgi:hypothetical protein
LHESTQSHAYLTACAEAMISIVLFIDDSRPTEAASYINEVITRMIRQAMHLQNNVPGQQRDGCKGKGAGATNDEGVAEALGLANGEAVMKGESIEKSIVAARESCCCDTV